MKKTAVVTGANRGLGLALSKELIGRGYDVFALCRKRSPLLNDLGAHIIDNIDLTDAKKSMSLLQRIPISCIDLLIHNAGLGFDDSLHSVSYEQICQQFAVNACAPLLLTQIFLPFLKEYSKIALISSRFGSIASNSSGHSYAYRMSKASLNMLGKNLAIDLRKQGIAVGIFSPGQVDTDMLRALGISTGMPPEEAAKNLIRLIEALNLTNSGIYWHIDGSIVPW